MMKRLGEWLLRLLRGLQGLLALALVLLALYVSVGRELLPLLDDYRPQLQASLQRSLGMAVRIERLDGQWHGLSPTLAAHQVQLGDGDDRLLLERIELRPDIPASLLAGELRLMSMSLSGLHMQLQEQAPGQWQVQGLASPSAGVAPSWPGMLQRLRQLGQVNLYDSHLLVQPLAGEPLALSYVNLSLRSRASGVRLDGRVMLPDGQPLAWQLQLQAAGENWRDSAVRLYAQLPLSDWAPWLQRLLPEALQGQWQLGKLQLGGELWLDWQARALQTASLRLQGAALELARGEQAAQAVDDLSLLAHYRKRSQGHWLQLQDLGFSQGGERWLLRQLQVIQTRNADEPVWQLRASELPLAVLTPLLSAWGGLPPLADEVMLSMAGHGRLEALQLDFYPQRQGLDRLSFAANLQNVGFAPWRAVPGAEHITGYVAGDLAGGELQLAGERFMLHFPTLFAEPWHYRQPRARLLWQVDEQAFSLISPYLQLEADEGRLAGDFMIRLRFDPQAEDYMDLRVGLREGDARFAGKYLPSHSPGFSRQLDGWLRQALQGGRVKQGYFQYQGSLNKGAPPESRSLSLYFDVEQAELAYQAGWPALREGRGQVLVDDNGVRVGLQQGQVGAIQIAQAQAEVATAKPGQMPRLQLHSQLQADLQHALGLLQETPQPSAEVFAGWRGEGPVQGQLHLDLPLQQGQAPRVQVELQTEQAQLYLAQADLQFSEITGRFDYDTALGMRSTGLSARTLGHVLNLQAFAEGRQGRARTRLEVQGRAPVAALLKWQGLPASTPLRGQLPYRLRVLLADEDSLLRVLSDLRGLHIDLPEPFGKSAEQRRDMAWRMTLSGAERRYWLDMDGLLSLAAAAAPQRLRDGRGEVRLGGAAARLPVQPGWSLRGALQQLDLQEWQRWHQQHQAQQPTDLRWLSLVDLDIAQIRVGELTIDQAAVQLQPQAEAWRLALRSPLVSGSLLWPAQGEAPLQLQLDYLDLPRGETPVDPSTALPRPDPLAGFDPRRVPAMDMQIDELRLAGVPVGRWRLQTRPQADGVRLQQLDLQMRGLQLTGEATWTGSAEHSQSSYRGRLQGGDLGKVLRAWDYAPSASSESFRVDVDAHWPGSPAWVSLKRVSGDLHARLDKGQFVEADGGSQALRVFGLLNFNSIARRLRLDFSDLLGRGLAYDKVRGQLQARDGVFVTSKPLRLSGPSSNLELNGTLDMANEQIDAKLLVTLPVSNNLPLAAVAVGAPAIGGALFVVDKLLGDRLARFASVQYDVKGPWNEPQISFDKPFEKPR